MKTVLLSVYRIKQYFTSNKLIFSLYLIGSILCGLMFIYFYGNGVSYMRNSMSQDMMYREYTIYFTENSDTELSEERAEFFDSFAVEDVLFGTEQFLEDGDSTVLTCLYKNNLQRYKDRGRIYFTDEEIDAGKMVVVLPIHDYTKIDDTVSLFGVDFQVIGRAQARFGDYCIPYTTFRNLGITPTFIKVVAAERQDAENDSVLIKLQQLYSDEIVEPPSAEKTEKSRASGEILLVCIIYAVCMLVFACLVKYMVELSALENVICMIVGASKSRLLWLLLTDTLFLSAISAGLSILIHYLCKNSVFAYLNQNEILYRASDYYLIFLFMIAISVLMIIPFICVICRNSIIKARNAYEV